MKAAVQGMYKIGTVWKDLGELESDNITVEGRQEASKEDGYPIIAWCNLIAWMMNCDNELIGWTKRVYTGINVWESNSSGELVFVGWAVNVAKGLKDKFGAIFQQKCSDILNGINVSISKDYSIGFGAYCRTLLWNTPPEFENAVKNKLGIK